MKATSHKSQDRVVHFFESDFPTGNRFKIFHNLMQYRIRNLLFVSSQYNLFLLEEDGHMYESLREESYHLNLSYTPEIVLVESGRKALEMLKGDHRFDMIITTAHSADITAAEFARNVRKINPKLPIVHLVFDTSEFNPRLVSSEQNPFDRIFTWAGNYRLIISTLKVIEDAKNVEQDVRNAGVQVILLVEDNIRFYSSYLPLLYSELLQQSHRLVEQGINLQHKFLRMRARPKILLATNYEEACRYFLAYEDCILGVISDINYMRNGQRDEKAGLHLARFVKSHKTDIPILLQSHSKELKEAAWEVGASFLHKDSQHLLRDMRNFVLDNLGFGNFIFRTESGEEVARADNLNSLLHGLKTVPARSLKFHAELNHFSNWLKARCEFWLAKKLRPWRISHYESVEGLRDDMVAFLTHYINMQSRGVLVDFNKNSFDPQYGFARVGTGSIGGKARGLSFLNLLLNTKNLGARFKNITIRVPAALILGTGVFDEFMQTNNLNNTALDIQDDSYLRSLFAKAVFPESVADELRAFLEKIKQPVAVRSSSLLEDSQYFPFAGVYDTFMLANNNDSIETRLQQLIWAIKMVYASTYCERARTYIRHTSFRNEEESMAIVIQTLAGNVYGDYFYPEISGVAKSFNYYSVSPQKPVDGVAALALGMGKTVVEGEKCLTFCPAYPKHVPQLNSVEQALYNDQKGFYAINLKNDSKLRDDDLVSLPVSQAEEDDSLRYVASTFSPENHAIYDGVSRPGQRLITMAPVLKQEIIPLAEILETILKIGKGGMGNEIEIEFAVRFAKDRNKPHEFCLLQMRPVERKGEDAIVELTPRRKGATLCYSDQVLGNGISNNICDVIVVDRERFDRSRTRQISQEIKHYNRILLEEDRPYLLITLGRLGSNDPWLGVPVHWEEIAGAKVIIESGIREIVIEPSQASHFFQNVSSFKVGYFTIDPANNDHFLNWNWLSAQKAESNQEFVQHIKLARPLTVALNGKKQKGIISID